MSGQEVIKVEVEGWGLLETGGRAGLTRGVSPLRPQLSAWGFPSCWLSRSHRLAGDSSVPSDGLAQEEEEGM